MKRPVWIFRDTVLSLHEQLLAAFGGSSGTRDPGLLDSALVRRENLLDHGQPDIFDLAASYGYGLVKNHPFIDGNKRTGFAVTVLFLELNGYRFDAGEADATVQTLALAAGELTESDFAVWLEANSRPARGRTPQERRPLRGRP